MIRNGNHFILLEGQWCLIGGPWFEYLEKIRDGHWSPIRLAKPWSMPVEIFHGKIPVDRLFEEVEWEARAWCPGWLTGRQVAPSVYERWLAWQGDRIRIGYVMLPDGRLPPLINMDKLPEDVLETEEIIRAEEIQRKP